MVKIQQLLNDNKKMASRPNGLIDKDVVYRILVVSWVDGSGGVWIGECISMGDWTGKFECMGVRVGSKMDI